MNLYEIMSKFNAGYVTAAVIVLLSIIQIAPVRLNPWDNILGWFGRKLNGGKLEELQKQVRDMWISSHRQSILTFARECRANVGHDSEEWANVLNQCEDYELYCGKNQVANGVVKSNIAYIRALYQELSRDHRI